VIDLKNLTLESLKELLQKKDYPSYCASQVFRWIYKKRAEDFEQMTNISKEARASLEKEFYFSKLSLVKRRVSNDKTEKFLFRLEDGAVIETVLIPEGRRNTLCVSAQVGCKFKCKFCASGLLDFKRNLKVSEIVDQYLCVHDLILPLKITNIVFMGIGEPLDNLENVVSAIKILTAAEGVSFNKNKISISTCGVVPGIKELARLKLGVKLSISLHSADNNIRSMFMPVNKKYPLGELMCAAGEFAKSSRRHAVTFEYILIQGLNTAKEDAAGLARLLRTVKAKVNLIPYNSFSPGYNPPSQEEIEGFAAELKKRRVLFTLRKPRGEDIEAACGQLRAIWEV